MNNKDEARRRARRSPGTRAIPYMVTRATREARRGAFVRQQDRAPGCPPTTQRRIDLGSERFAPALFSSKFPAVKGDETMKDIRDNLIRRIAFPLLFARSRSDGGCARERGARTGCASSAAAAGPAAGRSTVGRVWTCCGAQVDCLSTPSEQQLKNMSVSRRHCQCDLKSRSRRRPGGAPQLERYYDFRLEAAFIFFFGELEWIR